MELTPSCVSGVEVREGGPERTHPGADAALPFEKLGHYEIVSRLGQGGMGDVYLGYERSLDRRVAVKVLPAQVRDPDLIRRFRAEATAAARLIHPNIIQIYYIGEDCGHQFFAMQYVEGMSLARLLAQHPRLTIDESLAIIDEVLSGLVAAHQQGFVHRDIKPGNILIDREHRRALLADFGLVKSLKDTAAKRTSISIVLGTADYIVPEQGLGKTVDCRTDLYSTGVVLYQLLCGRLPFVARESTAVIYQHVHEPPPALGDVAPEVPPALIAIVNKLLAKLPEDRYQTAADALADVRRDRAGHSERELPGSLTFETTSSARPTRSLTPGPIETATEALMPTLPGLPAAPAARPADRPDHGRRRALLGLAAAALPAIVGGAWFALTPADDRSRWLSRLTGTTERETDEIRQFAGHPGEINGFVLTPDEELLIAGDRTGKLHIWDFALGELRKSIRAHSGPIRRVIVSEDGKFVITCSADQTLKMWDIKTWKQVTQFIGHVDVVSSVVQIPGRYEIISSSFDGTLIRWQMALGNQITRYGSILRGDDGPDFQEVDFGRLDRHLAWVRDVVIPAPGHRFVSAGNDGVLLVWDLDRGEVVDRLIGQAGVIMCLAISPDGDRILAGGYKKVICLWNLEEGRLLHRLPHDSATPACLAFSPDGRRALSGGADGVISVWDVASGARLHVLEGHDGAVTSVRFLSDGRRVLSGGEDRTLRLWKLPWPAAG